MSTLELITTPDSASWVAVCRLTDLSPDRGAAALVAGEQVALFRLSDGSLFAVQQLDPFSGAYVMSRGLVGSRADIPTVASPMYKQVFDLRTGACLDAVGKVPLPLRSWPIRVSDNVVMLAPQEMAWQSPVAETENAA